MLLLPGGTIFYLVQTLSHTMKHLTVNDPTRSLLQHLAARYETVAFLDGDPSWWMHQVQGDENREATAFVASVLSYGSRAQFMPKIGHLVELSGGAMHRWLAEGAYAADFTTGDTRCYYRLYTRDAMRRFFDAYSAMIATHGTMGAFIGRRDGLEAVEAICRWFASRGAAVVPKDTTSACKRVCMFLRWMVRSGSPVDLGLWADRIDRRTLIMPMDTHVVSEAINLGLLTSRSASMAAALNLTAAMSQVFPDDPLRGDFALFGYGVQKQTEQSPI